MYLQRATRASWRAASGRKGHVACSRCSCERGQNPPRQNRQGYSTGARGLATATASIAPAATSTQQIAPRFHASHSLRSLHPPSNIPPSVRLNRELGQTWRHWQHLLAQYGQASEEELEHVKSTFDSWRSSMLILKYQGDLQIPPAGRFLWEAGDTDAMRQAWHQIEVAKRRRDWPAIMLSTMVHRPSKTQRVLEATLEPELPGYAVDNLLYFIARRLQPRKPRAWDAQMMLIFLTRILDHFPPQHLDLQERTIAMLVSVLPATQARDFFVALEQTGRTLRTDTLLHVVAKLARAPAHRTQAFRILEKRISDKNLQQRYGPVRLNDPKCASVISILLIPRVYRNSRVRHSEELDKDHTAEQVAPGDVLQFFIEHGFQPNIITLTAFLNNVGVSGQVDEAFRLAQVFAEAGIKFDERAAQTLLRVAKVNLRPDMILVALDVAEKAGVPEQKLLNNALHAIFYFSQTPLFDSTKPRPTPSPFLPMLRLYVKRFDLEPLQRWIPDMLPLLLENEEAEPHAPSWSYGSSHSAGSILSVADDLAASRSGQRLLPPDVNTLILLLRAYIRNMTTRAEVASYYKVFQAHLSQRDEDPLVQHIVSNQDTILHDTFMMTMMQVSGKVEPAMSMFRDLLSALPGNNDVENAIPAPHHSAPLAPISTTSGDYPPNETIATSSANLQRLSGTASNIPPPSMFSYTIILKGLFRHRKQPRKIQQLLNNLYNQQTTNSSPNHPPATTTNSSRRRNGRKARTGRDGDSSSVGSVHLDLPAYNTLVKGFAMRQDVASTVAVLQHLEDAGIQPDDRTMRAFGKLRDQRAAVAKIEEVIEANRRELEQQQEFSH